MKRFSLLLFALLLWGSLIAQSPEGFNYQAVARSSDGAPLGAAQLTVQLSIVQGTPDGTVVWTEEHSVTTTHLGLFSVVVGVDGTRTGGTHQEFSDIDWSAGPYYLQTSVDQGSGLEVMGTSSIGTVPHALSAGNLTSPVSKLEVVGDIDPTDTVLFEVKRNDGTPVFAVYNNEVRVYVDETATKGVKGGFAVGGYNPTKGGPGMDYLWVTRDSTRVYVPSDTAAKGLKGGFAVGGYNPTSKSHHIPAESYDVEYLMGVNRDITRFNANDGTEGFAIGVPGGDWDSNFLRLTKFNYFMGQDAGRNVLPGAGLGGKFNTFFGYQAGANDVSGHHNIFLGHMAGWSNTGAETGNDGNYNIFIGYNAGYDNLTGNRNLFIGHLSGFKNIDGYENVFVGHNTGSQKTSGYGNVFLGRMAGMGNIDGNRNVFIGNEAGSNETGSDKLYIDNSNTDQPLIFGDFETNHMSVYGNAGINAAAVDGVGLLVQLPQGQTESSYTLYVEGSSFTAGNYSSSDITLKSDIRSIEHSLEKLTRLHGISFSWNEQAGLDRMLEGRHLGVSAQEVESLFPELVREDLHGKKAVNYAGLIPVLIEAMKEQQAQIEALKRRIEELEQ